MPLSFNRAAFMPLPGIATAIYGSEQESTVSLATLSAESGDEIYIDTEQKIRINPADIEAARSALMVVLDTMCTYRSQLLEIGEDKKALVPVSIVCGTGENHPQAVYAQMLRGAFPEYFENDPAIKKDTSINRMFEHLLLKHYATKGPIAADDEYSSRIAVNNFTLFLPLDSNHEVGETDWDMCRVISQLLVASRLKLQGAMKGLTLFTQADALKQSTLLRERKILQSTRFFQMGAHTDAFKKCLRYTYLESFDLKNVFVRALMSQQSGIPHNICLKTPNDIPGPPFSDITATFLADAWDLIEYERTGKMPRKRHVQAKRRR